jgi:D-arabinose 1-dehydrogenase-like Zn-dependent alcohol dehydrogenase
MGFVVVAVSGSPQKKDLALKLGAKHYISSKDDVSTSSLQKVKSAPLLTVPFDVNRLPLR